MVEEEKAEPTHNTVIGSKEEKGDPNHHTFVMGSKEEEAINYNDKDWEEISKRNLEKLNSSHIRMQSEEDV